MRSVALRYSGLGAVGAVAVSVAVLVAGGPAGATAPVGELYTANYNAGTVSQLGRDAVGNANPLAYPLEPSSGHPSHIVVTPNGKYAYALDCSAGVIRQYTVDPSGLLIGALVPMAQPVVFFGACGADPVNQPTGHQLAITKTSTFLVATVVGTGENVALVYKIGSTGALSETGAAEIPAAGPDSVAIAPSGKYFYVTAWQGHVYQYTLSTTGVATLKADMPAPACISDLAITPNGTHAYATITCGNFVGEYSVNTTTGVLTGLAFATTGNLPATVVVAPNGKTAYLANAGSNSVAQYKVATNGTLTALSPAVVPVGVRPLGLAVGALSKSLYVANFGSGTVSEFSINATTLQLTATGTVSVGPGAWGIAARK
jgi:DNA-binding beta-propeller fold protein YncE